ncbi:peptidoglycan-binding protein, partial [Coprobacillus cateniformis]|nr:peptidoglycan-binding protein [Coprobacillus cateniformis]
KYTNAKWLTPNGNNINGEGFKPDYEVKSQSINDFHIGEFKGPYQYDQVDDNIQYMQEMLKELGYKVDRVDGYYSKATEEALKSFEKRYGLAVNGIYDKNDATIVLSALLYHIYQELEDAQYLKVTELIK